MGALWGWTATDEGNFQLDVRFAAAVPGGRIVMGFMAKIRANFGDVRQERNEACNNLDDQCPCSEPGGYASKA